MDIALRGELWDNDSADVLRWYGWRDITAPVDIAGALRQANGEDVTVLINSPGGDMAVGLEIRSILRRYPGKTTALYQGFGASAATLAASGCQEIVAEPGALLCYHNPSGGAEGDWRDLAHAAEGLMNARDCILEVYQARRGTKSREELVELMDKDLWISPRQALAYGLIDRVAELEDAPAEPAAFVAATGRRIRLTAAMRDRYREHLIQETAAQAEREKAKRVLAHIRALANY